MITLSNTTQKKEPIPPLIKVFDVATILSVSRHTVYKLIDSGDLQAADINCTGKSRKHIRVTRESLVKFYAKRFGHALNRALANPFTV